MTTRARRSYEDIYSYHSKTFDIVCRSEKYALFSLTLTVTDPKGQVKEYTNNLTGEELYNEFERLKAKYIFDYENKLK